MVKLTLSTKNVILKVVVLSSIQSSVNQATKLVLDAERTNLLEW
jgi:hypothetical protein